MKKNLFLFLFLSAVFKKQQPFVALVRSLTTNKYVHPFNHSLAHSCLFFSFLFCLATTKVTERSFFMQPTSCVTNLKRLRDFEFVYINVTIGKCLLGRVCVCKFVVNWFLEYPMFLSSCLLSNDPIRSQICEVQLPWARGPLLCNMTVWKSKLAPSLMPNWCVPVITSSHNDASILFYFILFF